MPSPKERLKERLISFVEDGLLGVNDLGYYYPLEVPKRRCFALLKAVLLITDLVRIAEREHTIAITDRFGIPAWKVD